MSSRPRRYRHSKHLTLESPLPSQDSEGPFPNHWVMNGEFAAVGWRKEIYEKFWSRQVMMPRLRGNSLWELDPINCLACSLEGKTSDGLGKNSGNASGLYCEIGLCYAGVHLGKAVRDMIKTPSLPVACESGLNPKIAERCGDTGDSYDSGYGSGGNGHSAQNNKGVVAIIIASVSAFFLITGLVYFTRKGWVCKKSTMLSSTAPLVTKDDIELLQLSLQSIIDATNNFDDLNKLGEGGFGPVYKGFLSEFGMVAIKRLSKQSSQGQEEFMNELKLIAKLQHTNLVSLLGCCVEDGEKILIYDGYIPPEYVLHGQFSEKSDVFSYGVLLLEIVNAIKEPAYVSSNSIGIDSTSLPKSSGSNSKNEVTVSILEPL
nr:G-type lectin S-receptor-like serine/threonine-protein kinase At4g27290 [Ipomoea batatas]